MWPRLLFVRSPAAVALRARLFFFVDRNCEMSMPAETARGLRTRLYSYGIERIKISSASSCDFGPDSGRPIAGARGAAFFWLLRSEES